MIGVTENFRKIQDLLAKTARKAGRSADSVQLLAASKRQPVLAILAAAQAGQRDFGENIVQEGIAKMAEAARDDFIWHFIGRLQANKTRAVAEHFAWVHTIDRVKVAERLSQQRPADRQPLNVCIQVNIDDEASKSGVPAGEVAELARAIGALPGLTLRGLMCLPAIRHSFAEQRKPFARLRELKDSICADGLNLDTLSMGMSNDFVAAIYEGATIVRLGTALFGPRK